MYTSLLYNVYVASSITTSGRGLTSSATMFFEAFLADNVKFGSVTEVVEFIDNVKSERHEWKFDDNQWIDNYSTITVEDVFAKLILECGYRWIPDEKEMEIIWDIVNNLDRQLLVRLWYKNNLYEFMENHKVIGLIEKILKGLNRPIMNITDMDDSTREKLNLFTDLLEEFVFYNYMVIDRIDRTNHMIKSVICVTDTDSCILSLDAWFRYISEKMAGKEFRIMNSLGSPIEIFEYTEEDEANGKPKPWMQCIKEIPKSYDYNFNTDEIIECKHKDSPDIPVGEDNMRFSIINIMGYALDRLINKYMRTLCENNHSIGPKWDRDCRIYMKSEFKGVIL